MFFRTRHNRGSVSIPHRGYAVMAVFVFVWLLATAGISVGASNFDIGQQQAGSAANIVKTDVGDKESLIKNLMNPLMGGGNLKTFDKSKSFNAQIQCPSNKSFLEVTVQPGSTGDITHIIVKQDINLDGTWDFYYADSNIKISGVCANGVISCNPGTWYNCKYYKWAVDANGRITVVEGGLSNLAGCYCINNSCGQGLVWSNLGVILKDIGGGMAGAILSAFPQTAISQQQLTYSVYGTTISFTGQKFGDSCDSLRGGKGPTNPSTLYGNGTSSVALDSYTSSFIQASRSDPDSYYNMIMNSTMMTSITSTQNSCTIKRVAAVNKDTRSVSGSGSYSGLCTRYHVFAKGEVVTLANGDKRVYLLVLDTSAGGVPHSKCESKNLDLPLYNSWHILRNVDIPDTIHVTNIVFCVNAWASGCTTATGACTLNPGQSIHLATCPATGRQYVSLTYTYEIKGITETLQNTISNGCTAMENDPSCKIYREEVDGVVEINNYKATGLKAQPICKTLAGETKSVQICDWWVKKRTYVCDSRTQQYDFSDAKRRAKLIHDTTKDNRTSFYYEDTRKLKDGSWTGNIGVNSPLFPHGNAPDCEQACKTVKSAPNVQVAQSGPATRARTDDSTNIFSYKTCNFNAARGLYTCPVGPDERIVTDCTCISDFNTAAVAVQMIRLAGQDLICSDNVPKRIK